MVVPDQLKTVVRNMLSDCGVESSSVKISKVLLLLPWVMGHGTLVAEAQNGQAMMRRIPLLFLAVVLLSLFTADAHAQESHKRHILVLNSYHSGLSWTDDTIKGIESALEDAARDVELHLEFMDTKRFLADRYFEKLHEIYKLKYGRLDLSLVIAVDNDALDFALKYHEEIFPDTPVVFCGINNFKSSMTGGNRYFTGVVEETDVKSTIEIALKLHPRTEQIVVVNDWTTTGIAMKNEVLEVAPYFKDSVKLVFLDDLDMTELQERIRKLPPKTIILMTVFNYDKTGRFFTYEESLALLHPYAKAPIYSVWDFYLGGGIVGGMLTSAFQQGKTAGEIALRVLRGEEIANIPVVMKSPNRYMFDYKEMARFGVESSLLPQDAMVMNLPDTYYSRYKTFILASAATILFLSIVIFVLLWNISLRKRIENALRESEEKYRDLYDNAPDMYHSVDRDGIIIECNETEARIFGCKKEEIIGRPITDLLSERSGGIHEKEFSALKKMKSIQGLEREFVRKDGTTFTASLNVFFESDGNGDLVRTKTIGRDITEQKRVEEELRRSREELRNLSAHIESTREEERGHIAREIHDELGGKLSKLKLDISWLRSRLPEDNSRLIEKTEKMSDLVDGTIDSIQRISSELRPGVLDYLGLSAAIHWQAGEFRERAGIESIISIVPEDVVLDQDFSIAVFRIFQETLRNVVRHAEASRVEIDLTETDGAITLRVTDNGKGITGAQISDPASFGLMGIRERARFLGGSVRINGIPGQGTTVTVNIPARHGSAREDAEGVEGVEND